MFGSCSAYGGGGDEGARIVLSGVSISNGNFSILSAVDSWVDIALLTDLPLALWDELDVGKGGRGAVCRFCLLGGELVVLCLIGTGSKIKYQFYRVN